jgi:hypothetical protein
MDIAEEKGAVDGARWETACVDRCHLRNAEELLAGHRKRDLSYWVGIERLEDLKD